MDNALTIGLLVALVIVSAIAFWMYQQKQRTEQLQGRFGPEYRHAVESEGDRSRAEAQLEARARRVDQLQIRSLTPAERDEFAERWHLTQARFVDSPEDATYDADTLVEEVMQARGYPMGNFEQRADDVSVDHPHVIEHYRAAHTIVQRNKDRAADTEELRTAFTHYRALFDDLLEVEHPTHATREEVMEGRR